MSKNLKIFLGVSYLLILFLFLYFIFTSIQIDRLNDFSYYKELQKEIQQTEKRLLIEIKSLKLDIGGRVGTLEKYKWLILGGSIVVGWILSRNFAHIVQMMS